MKASNGVCPAAVLLIAELLHEAKAGVRFSARDKATCPACGQQLTTYKTMPWDGCFRTRYHKCINPDCPLAIMDQSVKSIEEL